MSRQREFAGIQGSVRPGGLCEVLDCGRKLLTTFDEKDVSRSKDATYHVKLRRVEWLAIVEGASSVSAILRPIQSRTVSTRAMGPSPYACLLRGCYFDAAQSASSASSASRFCTSR
jgi:hypothetical protein